MKRCPEYLGPTCIDGGCPIALADEYAERGYDVIHSCDDCLYYEGCEDCAWACYDDCPNYKKKE